MADHASAHEGAKRLRCIVVTPESTLLDESADFVALPLFDGEIGIAPLHSPMIGRLGYGEMRVMASGRTECYYVDGGFVQVADDLVSVLTSRALRARDVNEATAVDQLTASRNRPTSTPELMAIRDRIVAQARAQIRVAQRNR